MVKTGSEIFTVLSIVAAIMPLLPVIILFLRHPAPSPVLQLLRTICILVFVHHLLILIRDLTPLYPPFLSALFRLAEFSLLYYLFAKAALPHRLQQIINMLLISFISVTVTVYALRGINAFPTTITALQSGLLNLLALAALIKLIGNGRIVIFREPLFWIAGGVLCYYGTYLLIEILTHAAPEISGTIEEKWTVFTLARIIGFIFFSIAAYVASVRRHQG